jgi:hypothetical protein
MHTQMLHTILRVQGDSDGLTLRELLGSLPTDPASLFVLFLVAGGIAAIVHYGAGGGRKGKSSPESDPAGPPGERSDVSPPGPDR